MERNRGLLWVLVAPTLLVACSGGGGGTPAASEDERGAVGNGNPASEYCVGLGYKESMPDFERCVFPDGTSCPGWDFFRGTCGQEHSYCNRHGGSVANREESRNGVQISYALCTTKDGRTCEEREYASKRLCAGAP